MFEKVCRFCAKRDEYCVPIFSAEGDKNRLKHKVKVCAPINVSESDTLPKEICVTCLSSLDQVYEFYQKIKGAQLLLKDVSHSNSKEPEITKFSGDSTTGKENSLPPLFAFVSGETNTSSVNPDDNDRTGNFKPIKGLTSSKRSSNPHSRPSNSAVVDIKPTRAKILKSEPSAIPTSSFGVNPSVGIVFKKCRHCEKEFREDILAQHEKLHDGKPVLTCAECDGFFVLESTLKKHVCTPSKR